MVAEDNNDKPALTIMPATDTGCASFSCVKFAFIEIKCVHK